jgi:hypothetical protein
VSERTIEEREFDYECKKDAYDRDESVCASDRNGEKMRDVVCVHVTEGEKTLNLFKRQRRNLHIPLSSAVLTEEYTETDIMEENRRDCVFDWQ